MTTKKQKLFSDTLLYMIGNFGSKTISFFLIPFYTRYLNTAEYGIMDFVNTTKSLILPFIYLQIIDGVYRYLLDSKYERKKQIISSSFFFVVLMIFLSLVLFYSGVIIVDPSIEYINLITAMFTMSIFNSLFRQILRGLDRLKLYSISGIITTFFIGMLNIYFIGFLNMSYNGMILATTISLSISSLVILVYGGIYKYINLKSINKKILYSLIKYSIPLLPNGISWWFMNVSDRYLISYFLNFEYLGIYAIANKFASVIYLFNTIFYQAWQTSAIDEFESENKNEYYTEIFNYLLNFQLILVLLGTISVRLFIQFLVGAEFVSAWEYTPILFLAAMFNSFSAFYGTGYLSAKNTIKAFSTTSIGALVNILVNIILIPKFGLMAASLSTLMSYLVVWIVRVYTTKNYFEIEINYKKLFSGLLLIFISSIVNYLNSTFLIIVFDAIIILIMFSINRYFISEIYKKIKLYLGNFEK